MLMVIALRQVRVHNIKSTFISIMVYYQNHQLYIGKHAIQDIAEQYPTPFYLYDEQKIHDNIKEYHDEFAKTSLQYTIHLLLKPVVIFIFFPL